jgi:ADP-heptose:LPS heptosyltransferase
VKILVIRFSSIGDIVLISPVLRCIRQQRPDAQIHLLTKQEFSPVVAANPNIDRIHYLGEDLNIIVRQLKAEKFDYVADLHNNLRTARVKTALGVKETHTFPKLNIEKWLYVNLKINLLPDKSIVARYFEAVKPLGIYDDGQGLDFFISKEFLTTNEDIPTAHWTGYVACVIGGSYNTKKLPVENWQAFCDEVPYPVMLLGGADDREAGRLIAAQDPVKIYNSCGKFNLAESAHLVQRARVVVSNDTGLMHIAAAFGRPVISLWGNTAPDFGMFPYYGGNNLKERISPKSKIIEFRKLYCHPCSKLGYDRCPKGHFKCMKNLDTHIIVENVKKFWT